MEWSEVRQELSAGMRRTTRWGRFTIHPTVRVAVARERVRFYGENHAPIPDREVDEARVFWGFERALSWGGRYRWGLESHTWKGKADPMLNAVGLRGEFWWLRQDGSPIVTVDGNANSRYQRVLFTGNMSRTFKRRWTIAPSMRAGVGRLLPAQETFFLGGFAGFPGYRVFEARGTVENSVTFLIKYQLTGSLYLTLESVGGAIFDEDSVRAEVQRFPDRVGRYTGRSVDGESYGFLLETPAGPFRVQVGHNTTGRQQASISLGSWR